MANRIGPRMAIPTPGIRILGLPGTEWAMRTLLSCLLVYRMLSQSTPMERITTTSLMSQCTFPPFRRCPASNLALHRGAMFIVLRRAKGWWQVQKDPNGTGVLDSNARKGWVPAGCLLETNAPPSTAIAEASSQQPTSPSFTSLMSPATTVQPMSDAPILPTSIISTSYPGIALMDWAPQGDHELELAKDDVLRVFKRYNHWSYVSSHSFDIPFLSLTPLQVVKGTGRRGWVPSWLIGKISSSGTNHPNTPATAMTNYDDDGPRNGSNSSGFVPQPSPMSPAFQR